LREPATISLRFSLLSACGFGVRVLYLPSLTSQYRACRGRKKIDVIDAENVAWALLANPKLPKLHAVDYQRQLQELTRTQRRLSEQLKASRGALQELLAESPVREVLHPFICILVDQLKVLQRQIRLMVNKLTRRRGTKEAVSRSCAPVESASESLSLLASGHIVQNILPGTATILR
jgi:transposase